MKTKMFLKLYQSAFKATAVHYNAVHAGIENNKLDRIFVGNISIRQKGERRLIRAQGTCCCFITIMNFFCSLLINFYSLHFGL